MKNKDENIEEILLSNTSLDDLIKKKIEHEFLQDMEKSKLPKQKKKITEIAKVPKGLIFTARAVFELFNRKTGTKTYINGIQAESMLGLQNSTREKMAKGEVSAFATDNAYVKFNYIEIQE